MTVDDADDRERTPRKRTADGRRVTRRGTLAAVGAVGVGLLAGCTGDDAGADTADAGSTDAGAMGETDTAESATGTGDAGDTGATATGSGDGMDGTATATPAADLPAWYTTELSAVRSEETFTVAGLDGPVVLQGFAVWCPKCERQSNELAGVTDDATVVSLNVDPNEDASQVEEHAASNGFGWRFAIAPTEMTESLVDQFGTAVTTPPSTPVIVACPDGSTTFMSGEVNAASEIATAVDDC